jgi:signal transduction protein with GAF and PtsI domain
MGAEEKIDIELFKVVFMAMAQSDNLEIMANHLTQLLVGALNVKGCVIFVVNPDTQELEPLAAFGLSMGYVNKGPVLTSKSIADTFAGKPVVVPDIEKSDLLQYPQRAREEGIRAIISIPIQFYETVLGNMRLYHREVWEISEKDVDSLVVLSRNIGLAMVYTRLLKAFKRIKYTVEDVAEFWRR